MRGERFHWRGIERIVWAAAHVGQLSTWSGIQRTGQVNSGANTPHSFLKPGPGKENNTKAFESSKWTLETEIAQDLGV